MVAEDNANKILEYLKKQGQANTFRLATELGVDRHKLLSILKKLEEKQAIDIKSGIVRFLKFPTKEKKIIKKAIKKISKPKKKVKAKVKKVTKAEQIEKLKEKIKELEKKARARPKIIRRTITKKIPVKSRKLKEQAQQIEELEETIEELRKKVKAKPKIIRRTIIKKVPVEVPPKIIRRTIVKKVPKIIRKTIIKKIPVKVKEKILKPPIKPLKLPKKFKIPKFNFLKNIQKLHVPEIIKKP